MTSPSDLAEQLLAVGGGFLSPLSPEDTRTVREAASALTQLEADLAAAKAREARMREALRPFAEAIRWEETEGNFGAQFMPDAPAQYFRDEVELRFVAWWGKDEELESADTFCTLGDLRRAAAALEP